jgi:hypothetical protein
MHFVVSPVEKALLELTCEVRSCVLKELMRTKKEFTKSCAAPEAATVAAFVPNFRTVPSSVILH